MRFHYPIGTLIFPVKFDVFPSFVKFCFFSRTYSLSNFSTGSAIPVDIFHFGIVMVSTISSSVSRRSDTAAMPEDWMRLRDWPR